jgi:hypothetical protein
MVGLCHSVEESCLVSGCHTSPAVIKVLADTSAIWDALRFQSGPDKMEDHDRSDDAKAFWQLLGESTVTVYYNSLADHSLSGVFPDLWKETRQRLMKAPVPLSRADGYYQADGSLKYGGRFGGTLRILLVADHKAKLETAVQQFKDTRDDSGYKAQRGKEFDYEHLETALELEAEFFITTDYRLLRRLKTVSRAQRCLAEVQRVIQIVSRPVDALRSIRAKC